MTWWRLGRIAHFDARNVPPGYVEEQRREARRELENMLRSAISRIVEQGSREKILFIRQTDPESLTKAYDYLGVPDFFTIPQLEFYDFVRCNQLSAIPHCTLELFRKVKFHYFEQQEVTFTKRPTRILLPPFAHSELEIVWKIPYPAPMKPNTSKRSYGISQLLYLKNILKNQENLNGIIISVYPIKIAIDAEDERGQRLHQLIRLYSKKLQEQNSECHTYLRILEDEILCFVNINLSDDALIEELLADIGGSGAFTRDIWNVDSTSNNVWRQLLMMLPHIFSVDEVTALIQPAISFGDERVTELQYLL